jgi:hypothetical protein
MSLAARGKARARTVEKTLEAEFKPMTVLADKLGAIPFDREEAFQLYALFGGDIEKVAQALTIPATEVLRVANALAWKDRLNAIVDLKKNYQPRDVERVLNRAMNFVQAHRLRMMVSRVLTKLYNMDDEELNRYAFMTVEQKHKDGSTTQEIKLNTKPFSDLAIAMEKAQMLTYLALSDSQAERNRRGEDSNKDGITDLHSSIADALAKIRKEDSPQAQIFDAQLVLAEEIRVKKEEQARLDAALGQEPTQASR